MEGTDAADLGELLASAEVPSTGGTGRCALCDRSLGTDEGIVEVEMDTAARAGRDNGSGSGNGNGNGNGNDGSGSGRSADETRIDPDAWLCKPCYGYVVGDMGVVPTRVFKAGRHRTVVLPVTAGSGKGNGTDPSAPN